MQLSNTSSKILAVLFGNPDRSFYINELVRHTSLYPNSVFRSLQILEKQKILTSSKSGKFKFYKINPICPHLNEIKQIVSIDERSFPSLQKQKWVKVLNREAGIGFHFALCKSNVTLLKRMYGITVPNFWYNSITGGVYYMNEELISLGSKISELLEKNPSFAKRDINLCYKKLGSLLKISKVSFHSNLKNKTKTKLYKLFKKFWGCYLDVFPFITTPHAIERFFERKIRENVKNNSLLEIFLSPIYVGDEETEGVFKIAIHAKKYGFNRQYERMLSLHWENFCWLPLWSLRAKPLSRDYFNITVKNILEHKNPESELKKIKAQEKEKIDLLNKTFNKIKAAKTLKNQVLFLQKYIFLRTYRKNIICQAHYYHLPLLYEIAYRMKLSQDEIKHLNYEEILSWFKNESPPEKLKNLAKKRMSGWAMLMWQGEIKTICGAKNIIETMEQYQIVHPSLSQQRVVVGTVASRGKVRGRVKIVRKLEDLNKVEKGDVLVAKMTTPDYMVAINKAVAIVTDEGGVTCHAAIVSREFNLPCITGARIATKTLADNDLVEVDAFEGKVRVLEAVTVPEDVKYISGRTIYKGKVRGTARIIFDSNDFQKIQNGDILITSQTTPEYLSLLYRVKAFAVDEDSLTSHAVAYGQALAIPSIMGTQFARNVIRDGEEIELDATKGIIKRL